MNKKPIEVNERVFRIRRFYFFKRFERQKGDGKKKTMLIEGMSVKERIE